MISRIAENCFLTFRYVERVECLARRLLVDYSFSLDNSLSSLQSWHPLWGFTRETKSFQKLASKHHIIQHSDISSFLIWDETNPNTISTSVKQAREYARTVREIISDDMWFTWNELHLWLKKDGAKKHSDNEHIEVYKHIIRSCQQFIGNYYSTLYHNKYFQCMAAGMLLERTQQTVSMLHEMNINWLRYCKTIHDEPKEQLMYWTLLLQFCLSHTDYLKQDSEFTPPLVIQFLLRDPLSPYSALYCLHDLHQHLILIPDNRNEADKLHSISLVANLIDSIIKLDVIKLFPLHIEEEIQKIISRLEKIDKAIDKDFFI